MSLAFRRASGCLGAADERRRRDGLQLEFFGRSLPQRPHRFRAVLWDGRHQGYPAGRERRAEHLQIAVGRRAARTGVVTRWHADAFVPGASRKGVWVMRGDSTKRHRITIGAGGSLFLNWSPGSRWIVFADLGTSGSGLRDLTWCARDGSVLKRLTRTSADELSPAWAPNGREIVCAKARSLWRMKPDGSGQRLLAASASSPSWSPAGTHIAFIRGGDPWVIARDGTGAKRVAQTSSRQTPRRMWGRCRESRARAARRLRSGPVSRRPPVRAT